MTEDCKTKYPIGSKWKTRDSGVATIIYHNDDSNKWPLIALIKDENEPVTYTKSGHFYPDTGDHEFDLIEPYVEPKRGVGYVNVYEGKLGVLREIRETREEADKSAYEGRLACIRLEWAEGQFDD